MKCVRCPAEFERRGPQKYCPACQVEIKREWKARWRANRLADRRAVDRPGRPRKTGKRKNLFVNWEVGDRMILAGDDLAVIADTLRVSIHTVYGRRLKLRRWDAPGKPAVRERICNESACSIDRGRGIAWRKWMLANPVYFEDIFHVPCTAETVAAEWRILS